MINQNKELEYSNNNILNVLVGLLIGSLAGAVAMLLLAPQSGKDTRMQIEEKGIKLRNRTNEMVEDTMAQIRLDRNKLTIAGREKIKDLKQHGQEIVAEQLEHVSDAAQAGKKAIQSS